MKKNYAKILVAAAFVAVSALSLNAQTVVFEENFDKLANAVDANGAHLYGKNPWTGTDAEGVSYQPNYTNIVKDGHTADLNGWTSVTAWLYACQGYIRLSKTNYGGDAISPKLSALNEATDVKLSWQGIGYTSNVTLNTDGSYKSGGVHDYQYYCVGVIGGGTIEGATKTKDIAVGTDTINCAVIEIPTEGFITMDTLAAWNLDCTKNELTIKNATANTQIVFASIIPSTAKTDAYATDDLPIATDAPHGTNNKVNRVIIDNVKVVTIPEPTAVTDINTAKAVKAQKVIENGQVLIVVGDKKFNLMGVQVK